MSAMGEKKRHGRYNPCSSIWAYTFCGRIDDPRQAVWSDRGKLKTIIPITCRRCRAIAKAHFRRHRKQSP